MIKIGRRGSLNAVLTARGVQGHVAYPHRANNPVHRLVGVLRDLLAAPLDAGSDWFEPSGLQVTSVDVGNPATNVIPGEAVAKLNIRFNDLHSGAGLTEWLRGRGVDVQVSISGESFLTAPGRWTERLAGAVEAGDGGGAAAGYGGRHVGCAVHCAPLPGGGVRAGGADDAPGR